MDQDVDLLRRKREEMMRFNEFQPFVHQGCRIDRDLRAHRPIGMLERLLDGRGLDRLGRGGAKRTSGGGQNHPAHVLAAASAHGLKQALCSESTGSTVAPDAAARRMNRPPAHTSVSLLASATMAPRSAAASVGLRPAAPVIAPITHSAGRSAASIKPLSPAATSIPVPASAALRSP